MMFRPCCFAVLFSLFTTCIPAMAGGADAMDAKAVQSPNGTWRFDVTVAHADEGWQHCANAWQVVGPDGKVLATRVLAHPHVDEQPFTRSKSGIVIPDGVSEVTIRAGDLVHGYSGRELQLRLTN